MTRARMARRSCLSAAFGWVLMPWLSLQPVDAPAATTCSATVNSYPFGSISLTATEILNGTVTVQCVESLLTVGLVVNVRYCLSIGSGSGGSGALLTPRRMQNALSDTLDFDLLLAPGWTTVAGSLSVPSTTVITGTISYITVAGLLGSGSATHTVRAQIPPQANAGVGSYSSDFSGAHTSLDYRYIASVLTPAVPSSCTSGGNGGGSAIRAPFTVTATVAPECVINGATDMDFGSIPGLIATPATSTSTITLTCRRRTAWQMSLNDGQNASGQTRRMARSGGGTVDYELFRDAAMTQRFGQTVNVDRVIGTGTGSSQSVTVYGRIPASQSVAPGAYSDRVIVTVTY